LVRRNYIKGQGMSVYKKPLDTVKSFPRNTPFRCPEGVSEDLGNNNGGEHPTALENNGYRIEQDGNPGAQLDGICVATWYQLNTRNQSDTNRTGYSFSTGLTRRITPFVYFNNVNGGAPENGLKHPDWQRSLSMVRKSAELLMIVEATNSNWYDQTDSSTYPGNFLRRLGARHGQRTPHSGGQWPGGNASTNMAFFDGHVALYPTKIFENPKDQMDNQVKEVIFYVNKQRGR
jgi:prepilin-type processing-associated H-X9-DG protein